MCFYALQCSLHPASSTMVHVHGRSLTALDRLNCDLASGEANLCKGHFPATRNVTQRKHLSASRKTLRTSCVALRKSFELRWVQFQVEFWVTRIYTRRNFCVKIYRLICSTILAGISTRWNVDLTLSYPRVISSSKKSSNSKLDSMILLPRWGTFCCAAYFLCVAGNWSLVTV